MFGKHMQHFSFIEYESKMQFIWTLLLVTCTPNPLIPIVIGTGICNDATENALLVEDDCIYDVYKGLFTNYVISKLTYMVLQIMTQHDAIYQVGSLIMMNDGPSLLSLELALK